MTAQLKWYLGAVWVFLTRLNDMEQTAGRLPLVRYVLPTEANGNMPAGRL